MWKGPGPPTSALSFVQIVGLGHVGALCNSRALCRACPRAQEAFCSSLSDLSSLYEAPARQPGAGILSFAGLFFGNLPSLGP